MDNISMQTSIMIFSLLLQILPVLFKDVAKATLASHSTVAAWGFTMTLANVIGDRQLLPRVFSRKKSLFSREKKRFSRE